MKTSTDQAFLDKLTEITETNLKNDQFGVSELAEEIGISRSNLYLRVNSITQKSVSRFIGEIRLKKALELLRQGSLTISEVAYEVGFGSPTYFTKCFHEYYGFPPGEVGKRKADINNISTPGSQTPDKKTHLFQKQKKRNITLVASSILLLVILAIVVVSPTISKKKEIEKSIAVLPFKNLNHNPEDQYFTEGIAENILNTLSYINKLKIISSTSSDTYKDTKKSLPHIARELKVSYILEGSVQLQGNNAKIIVQLNDAKRDRIIWSGIFNKELKDILAVQSEIATQIAEELKIVLSPEEMNQIEKIYTSSREAYNLYLEGRFYYRLRTKEGFETSIRYFQEALKIDTNFCLAYAGLADSYLTGSWYEVFPVEECIPKSRSFALKALSIDNKLPEAHATLGALATYFDYDWDKAEKELKMAIKINPGYGRAYKLYSEYLAITGHSKQSRQYINKAHEINPTYVNVIWLSYIFYIRDGDFDKALNESEKIFSLNNFKEQYLWRNFFVYIHQDKMDKAINEYKQLLAVVSSEREAEFLDNLYTTSGKREALIYIADFEEKFSSVNFNYNRYRYYNIAIYYALLNEKGTTIEYLFKADKHGHKAIRMKYERAFSELKKEPEFIELLRKMKMADA